MMMTLRTLRLVRAGEAAGDVRGGCAKAARARYRYRINYVYRV